MSNLLPLPKLEWRQAQVLQMQRKREELIKKRDRLTERIWAIGKMIEIYEQELSPEGQARSKKFWAAIRRAREEVE